MPPQQVERLLDFFGHGQDFGFHNSFSKLEITLSIDNLR
jgi:hypothetical protein